MENGHSSADPYLLQPEKERLSLLEHELQGHKTSLEEKGIHCTALEKELAQVKDNLKGEMKKASSLEQELSETVMLAKNLQAELDHSQRELQERLDLDLEKEKQAEERSKEFSAMEEKMRYSVEKAAAAYAVFVCIVVI